MKLRINRDGTKSSYKEVKFFGHKEEGDFHISVGTYLNKIKVSERAKVNVFPERCSEFGYKLLTRNSDGDYDTPEGTSVYFCKNSLIDVFGYVPDVISFKVL